MSSQQHHCTLCYGPFSMPTLLHCGHVYCLDCLSVHNERRQTNCPDCRKSMSGRCAKTNHTRILRQTLEFKSTTVHSVSHHIARVSCVEDTLVWLNQRELVLAAELACLERACNYLRFCYDYRSGHPSGLTSRLQHFKSIADSLEIWIGMCLIWFCLCLTSAALQIQSSYPVYAMAGLILATLGLGYVVISFRTPPPIPTFDDHPVSKPHDLSNIRIHRPQ